MVKYIKKLFLELLYSKVILIKFNFKCLIRLIGFEYIIKLHS